ncbi:MAG TPA: ATP-binding protein, partial [Candidatus Gastranaerophilales bacterium]|nr:ATP-binding protein [Candidatus Gastranaerophilales bacterium]
DTINFVKEYDNLPKLECYAGQMNQVFMNILDNAAQAIKETGNVYIRTKLKNNEIVIEFEDTGEGIEQEILNKIYDPFFTTKPVGSGSGLGLAITYKIIKSHNGKIVVESAVGKGTKFTLSFPLNWQQMEEKNDAEKEEVI